MLTTLQFKKMILAGLLTKGSLLGKIGGGADVGGGDLVRADFLNRGEAVVEYLKNTQAGQKIVSENKIQLDALEASLDVNVIKVTDDILVDRTGSVVDALGEPGLILLNKKQWAEYAENDLDNYFLVFHEMLRQSGVNDDNYIVSKKLIRFPEEAKYRNILLTKKPLLMEDSLKETIQSKEIVFGGAGCLFDSVKTWTRFDSNLNQFEIYPAEMAVSAGVNQRRIDRKNCAIRIPYKAQAGQKIIITQVDMNGEVDLQKNKRVSIDFLVDEVGGSEKIKNKLIQSSQNRDGGFLFRENKSFETGCGMQGMLVLNSAVLITDNSVGNDEKPSYVKVNKISLSMKSVRCTK